MRAKGRRYPAKSGNRCPGILVYFLTTAANLVWVIRHRNRITLYPCRSSFPPSFRFPSVIPSEVEESHMANALFGTGRIDSHQAAKRDWEQAGLKACRSVMFLILLESAPGGMACPPWLGQGGIKAGERVYHEGHEVGKSLKICPRIARIYANLRKPRRAAEHRPADQPKCENTNGFALFTSRPIHVRCADCAACRTLKLAKISGL